MESRKLQKIQFNLKMYLFRSEIRQQVTLFAILLHFWSHLNLETSGIFDALKSIFN